MSPILEKKKKGVNYNQTNVGDTDKATTENMLKNLRNVVCTMNELYRKLNRVRETIKKN